MQMLEKESEKKSEAKITVWTKLCSLKEEGWMTIGEKEMMRYVDKIYSYIIWVMEYLNMNLFTRRKDHRRVSWFIGTCCSLSASQSPSPCTSVSRSLFSSLRSPCSPRTVCFH